MLDDRAARSPSRRIHAGPARRAVALPLGGIGTGHVALCGDGSLRQWQLHHRPNHTAHLPASFFALRLSQIEPPGDVRRVLRSAAPRSVARPAPNVTDHLVPDDPDDPAAYWPPVGETEFERDYPFGRVRYVDANLPVEVELEAYTPFVPLDAEASGLPLASFAFALTNRSDQHVHGWLVAALQNAVGWDWATPIAGRACALYGGNVNRLVRRKGRTAIVMDNPSLPDDEPRAGEMALWTAAPCAALPRCASSRDALRFAEILKLLAPTQDGDWSAAAVRAAMADMAPTLAGASGPSPAGTTWNGALAAAVALSPGERMTVEFVIAWRFPNRVVDFDQFGPPRGLGSSRLWLGNDYSERHGTVLDVIDAYVAERSHLAAASRGWAAAIRATTLPDEAVDLLEAQPSLIRSPTIFRTADGAVFGFEGGLGASTVNWNGNVGGSCPLNCSHVYNYEQALAALFPTLERTMRVTELESTQGADGSLPHRVILPLWLPQLRGGPIGGPVDRAVDGMLGALLKTYREVRHGAGLDWLTRLWPRLKRVLGHVEQTWDPEREGVLRGTQPVTYDIALDGPNMFVGSLWLAALRAMEEMARIVEPAAAAALRARFEQSSERYDQLLWNGEYYVQAPTGAAYGFGEGCLSDQLIGQWWAHLLELGHILDPAHVRSALRAVVRHNLRASVDRPEHGYRVFADEDDAGLLVCSWPRGGRPDVPLRYCDEVWTGVELQVAAHCFMEGLGDEGLRLLRAVRDRYDGTRRNPYNHVECGDHYARAMAGWSVLEGLTGVRWNAVRHRLTVAAGAGRFPFLAGTAWGVAEVSADGEVVLECRGGEVELHELVVRRGDGAAVAEVAERLKVGRTVRVAAPA